MKATISNIYEIRNIFTRTTAAEAALAANADTIRKAVIEIETKHDDAAILAEFTQYDNEIDFDYIITDEATAEQHASNCDRSARDRIEICIFRHSDADAESTSKEFAEEHADYVMNMIEYYITNHEHVIEM